MGRLDGKVAVITGAASGMGRATATLFAREGATVALGDVADEAGRQAARDIVEAGGTARFWRLDVAREPDVKAVMDEVAATYGAIDILINCAGVIGVDKPTHELSEDEWDALFAIDVKGVFFATKHALPHMIARKRGSIVNFSSIYGLIGNDEFTAYHVAKGAVTMQTRQDAATYGKDNIRVNSVHPSTVLTPLVEGIANAYPGGLPAYEAMMTANQSLRRLGGPRRWLRGSLPRVRRSRLGDGRQPARRWRLHRPVTTEHSMPERDAARHFGGHRARGDHDDDQ